MSFTIKFLLLSLIILSESIFSCFSQGVDSHSIIPHPLSLNHEKGIFAFSASTVIKVDRSGTKEIGFLQDFLLESWGFKNQVVTGRNVSAPSVLEITEQGTAAFKPEQYELVVSADKITLKGKGAGLFYGIQSLIQLFPNEQSGAAGLPCVTINDVPRFGYRGLMLDVSRHFFTVQQVKDLLDLMAQYKLNRFHWHLTDDQGWRIEIKSFPKLTEVGAWRVPRLGDFNQMIEPPQPGEKATDGGYYTQDEIREVVQYAAERHIQVMPEIDVPGHCMAAIAAYPELSVTKNPETKVNPGSSFARWFPAGGFEMYVDNTLNPTDEKVYNFLDKVLGEVAELFPYEYIHIGGDECFKGFWEKDAGVQAFMKKMNIKDMHALQSYFIGRVNEIVRSKNKKLIGWDEILEGGRNEGVAVMNRFGEKSAREQAKQGIPLVMAPGNRGLYFDYAQSASDMEPINHGGYSPLWKSYFYNPVPTGLNKAEENNILGVEGCIWTEHIGSISKLQYMMLPRLLGLAEAGWSATENKDYVRFSKSALPLHLQRFDKLGYNYRVPTPGEYTDTLLTGERFTFDFTPAVPGAKIYYTLNGKQPGDADHEYKGPMIFSLKEGQRRVMKTIVITPSGRRSVVSQTVMTRPARQAAVAAAPQAAGIEYTIYHRSASGQGILGASIDSGLAGSLVVPEKYQKRPETAIVYNGLIKILHDDLYTFTSPDKNIRVMINGLEVHDSGKPFPKFDRPDPVNLAKGYHRLQISYLPGTTSPQKLQISFKGSAGDAKKMDEKILFR